eukprot:scaffold36016_cov129-Isochrysis_galbana.AAC.1
MPQAAASDITPQKHPRQGPCTMHTQLKSTSCDSAPGSSSGISDRQLRRTTVSSSAYDAPAPPAARSPRLDPARPNSEHTSRTASSTKSRNSCSATAAEPPAAEVSAATAAPEREREGGTVVVEASCAARVPRAKPG